MKRKRQSRKLKRRLQLQMLALAPVLKLIQLMVSVVHFSTYIDGVTDVL